MISTKKLIVIVSPFLLVGNVYSATICDAILQYGIFDRENTLDQRAKYELVKNAHCNSEAKNNAISGGIGYGEMFSVSGSNAKLESRRFCLSSFSEIRENRGYWNIVSKASAAISNAWQQCIKENVGGVSHYIEPTRSPEKFTYKILYTPDGKPYYTQIKSWKISGILSCKEDLPSRGLKIDSSGYEIQCERDPDKLVIITANTESGARNLRRVTLPAHIDVPQPQPAPVIITLCNGGMACGDKVGGFPREIDGGTGGTKAKINAVQACAIHRMKYYDHDIERHRINCGKNYGLVQWKNNKFVWSEVPICSKGWVEVINRIKCIKS